MRMWNALLFAATLVGCAHQTWAQQHSHSARPVVAQAPQTGAPPQTSASPPGAAMAHGAEVGLCGTCMEARAIDDDRLVTGAHRATLEDLTDWTIWADKVIAF